jgi:hypothetical protein
MQHPRFSTNVIFLFDRQARQVAKILFFLGVLGDLAVHFFQFAQ